MTSKDLDLLSKAEKLNPSEWSLADLYEKQADSELAKMKLRNISSRLYHREEASADII